MATWVPSMDLLYGTLILLLLFVDCWTEQFTYSRSSQCDKTILSDTSLQQHVTGVTVDCSEGHITWKEPYGALQITLTLGRKSPFKACFLASSIYTKAKISLEQSNKLQTLTVLNSTRTNMSKEMCFDALDSVRLFVETEYSQNSVLGKLHIDYSIEKVYNKLNVDSMQECKPCTEKELLHAYCSSDFVATGALEKVENNEESQETTLHLKVNNVIRQKNSRFKRHSHHGYTKYTGTVVAPLQCGIQYGEGEFLFTGKIRLGRAYLQCAPTMKEWKALRSKALRLGVNPCKLG